MMTKLPKSEPIISLNGFPNIKEIKFIEKTEILIDFISGFNQFVHWRRHLSGISCQNSFNLWGVYMPWLLLPTITTLRTVFTIRRHSFLNDNEKNEKKKKKTLKGLVLLLGWTVWNCH